MAAVMIDHAMVHKLWATLYENATGIAQLVRRQLGEMEDDGTPGAGFAVAMHSQLKITPRRRNSTEDAHIADIEGTITIKVNEREEDTSPYAISSVASEVAAALGEKYAENTTLALGGHGLTTDEPVVTIASGQDLTAAAGAQVVVTGWVQRISGSDRVDFTS